MGQGEISIKATPSHLDTNSAQLQAHCLHVPCIPSLATPNIACILSSRQSTLYISSLHLAYFTRCLEKMSNFDQCSLSSMLHTHDHLEKAPYHHFMTILHHKFVVSKPIDQTRHLVSVQNAHFLFRTGHLHVHDSVVWNSSSKNYSVLSSLNKNHSNWYEPTVKERSMKCVGPSLNVAYVFRNWFLGIYTHFLPDGLPVIAWLREIMPANATLVLAKHPMSEQIIDFVDAKFAAKHIHWAGFGEVLCAAEAHLLIYPPMPWRELGLLQRLRSWIRPPVPTPLGHNSSLEAVTVFYSRTSAGSVHHGRYMVKEHEEAILALIHTSMQAVLKGVHSRLV
eukprot:6179021-Pleurochrysis_carterae.AAC.1